jgi:hypothetical protein
LILVCIWHSIVIPIQANYGTPAATSADVAVLIVLGSLYIIFHVITTIWITLRVSLSLNNASNTLISDLLMPRRLQEAIVLHNRFFIFVIYSIHGRHSNYIKVKVNILLYSDPHHWTRSALYCWRILGKTEVCSVDGAVGSPANYSLAPQVHERTFNPSLSWY